MPLLIDSRFFRLQVCLNFFLSRRSCLSSELLVWLEIFYPRDCKFPSSHSRSNHLFCDLHLILLPLTFNQASLHASTQVSLINSDAVSMLSCFTAASNLDWTVCDLRPSLSLSLDLIFQKSLLYSVKMSSPDVSKESWLTKLAFIANDRWQCSDKCGINENILHLPLEYFLILWRNQQHCYRYNESRSFYLPGHQQSFHWEFVNLSNKFLPRAFTVPESCDRLKRCSSFS